MLNNTQIEYLSFRKSYILELGFPEKNWDLLLHYLDFIWTSNEELNLFSRQMTFEDLIDNHLIDCLLALRYLPQNLNTVADFGSGGGLPGVVFAIARPDVKFRLYEKSSKKQHYLVQLKTRISNIDVNGLIPDKLTGVDLVIARAFKPIDVIISLSKDYYNQGGKYLLLKGRKEKIEEEVRDSLKKFKNFKCQIEKVVSPVKDETERHLVLVHF